MPRAVLVGESIKIEGTRLWPDNNDIQIRLEVLENSEGNSYHDYPKWTSLVKLAGSRGDPYATIDHSEISRGGSWSATLPFPDSKTAQSADGRDIDTLVRPGSVIVVLVGGNAEDWFSVTRPARSGEYAPRVTNQPASEVWEYDELSTFRVWPRANGNPKPRALFEISGWTAADYGYREPEGLWERTGPLIDDAEMIDSVHEFNEEGFEPYWYSDAPQRLRAAFINEIGNTYTEAANFGADPQQVTTGAEALTEDSRLANGFSSPATIKRGRTITIKTGADRPRHQFGSRIYQGDAYRSFGWKRTNTSGNFTVKIPANCSPGRHKFALYDGTGELYGWNYINVTK